MGGRRRCCCCPEHQINVCDEDIWSNFLEDEAIGTWAVDPPEPSVKPCTLQETDGSGRLIAAQYLETKYQIVRLTFLNIQVNDRYSAIIDWAEYEDGEKRWYEFRYTRDTAYQATLAWYRHVEKDGLDNAELLKDCTADPSVWPNPQIGNLGDTLTLTACLSPVRHSAPPHIELYGSAKTQWTGPIRLWERADPPETSIDAHYRAGLATHTPAHPADVIACSFQPDIDGIPECQCPRTCSCQDPAQSQPIYPPAKLLLTYQGLAEPGEDDCSSLTGATVVLELYPCGGDMEWIGYADESAGCFAPTEDSPLPPRWILRCPSDPSVGPGPGPGPGPEEPWTPGPEDWILEIFDGGNSWPSHKIKLCTGPFEAVYYNLYSNDQSTCDPLSLVFEYGPGETWPDDGMYLGYFPADKKSLCPDPCFECGGSAFTGPEEFKHIHWRIIITAHP